MLKDATLTCDFFANPVPFSDEDLIIDGLSGCLSSFLDFGVVIPRRFPAFAIQPLFSVLEPTDAGVVGRD